MKLERTKALEMMKKGASYQEVIEATGINIKTLRSWKARYIVGGEGAKPKPKAKTQTAAVDVVSLQTELSEAKAAYESEAEKVAAFRISNDAVLQRNSELITECETLQHEKESCKADFEALQKAFDTLQQQSEAQSSPNNTPLILAVVALHLSAVYGVGEILSDVFHTWVMGYLTAAVFVSAGLIMFVSRRFSVGVSWVVLLATFILESYCNYLTIYLRMTAEKVAEFEQYTNTKALFLSIAVFVPLVNLALEYLLFTKPQTTENGNGI
jgi:transposase-like protein